jgi:hypothetical protein
VLEFLEFLIVVSLINVAARKSGEWYMWGLFLLGWGALCAFCIWPAFRLHIEARSLIIVGIITAVLVSLLLGVVPTAIAFAIAEIVRVQGPAPN